MSAVEEFDLASPPPQGPGFWLERLWAKWVTPGRVRFRLRDVVPADAARLKAGLAQMSAQSRLQRFLHLKSHLTPEELRYLTEPDHKRHLAWGIVRLEADGREGEGVAVGHVFRSTTETDLAEFAIAVVDAWHGRGLGARLTRALATASLALGIRRWQAEHLSDNHAVRRLLEMVGRKVSERPFGSGATEVVYELRS